ncbi:tyrosine-protein phosphatase [Kibdelosporangium philippinense]|uniref:Tyrosine-protein phosphatase n=1 Tax=Kibdelosporangium philippinense TaxID=211113 RepID=A0ABS8ZGC9_9PSEU|nr:tyrosine-protein phosphatase [Kibdelosporangium philippinense]MCE7006886.1 tyrosine-protein phosphatase [Kibdelosporangium philippinense]
MDARQLDWPGCFNVRDLGGLATADGKHTRMKAVVRSDAPDKLTERGWAALRGYGIRTIVDLRNPAERDKMPELADIDVVNVRMDPVDDVEFWAEWGTGLHGTALYFQPYLERFPHLPWTVLRAITHAKPGGVLINCAAGRDRTGLMALLLLALAGVSGEVIADDYEASFPRLTLMAQTLGIEDYEQRTKAMVERRGTTTRALVLETVRFLDISRYVSADDLPLLRDRLVGAERG